MKGMHKSFWTAPETLEILKNPTISSKQAALRLSTKHQVYVSASNVRYHRNKLGKITMFCPHCGGQLI